MKLNRFLNQALIFSIIFPISVIAPIVISEPKNNFLENYPDDPSPESNHSQVLNVAIIPWQSHEKQQ